MKIKRETKEGNENIRVGLRENKRELKRPQKY